MSENFICCLTEREFGLQSTGIVVNDGMATI